ncbi:tyrosine--tRNA ligase [Thalassospira sp.]|uniref:tyrosine--tRNA ligase n=1 Tax=Thalassospira sp. TaxID=1912094 RepID=UPI002732D7D3|nr:tyrosine--tRNA ligase [Thalassospira sp.]MDP2698192.1 tyrosine--tRNA ligase [Thalassospira sp.]
MNDLSPIDSADPADIAFVAQSGALQTLLARGFVHQCTGLAGLDGLFKAGCVPVYIGFDATADSLHVGHLLPIMTLRWLQKRGHKPIILVGGGTTRIGDPSFRTEARPILTDDQIAHNIAGIRKVFDRFVRFGDGPSDAVLVNNADWLDRLGYVDLLRDVGRHFSVNRMLSFDSVRTRLEKQENLSFLEFNYMILQAFDFLELSRRFGCRAQMGGADQWANILNGVDLVRRVDGPEVFGLTAPLLTTASGVKMGKTAAGAVWLNADRLAPFDYWQFWRNCEDGDVGRFLRLFTDLPLRDIEQLENLSGADINAAKIVLADEATQLAHGETALDAVKAAASGVFGTSGSLAGLPTLEFSAHALKDGVGVLSLLVMAGFAGSNSEARRLVEAGAVRIDEKNITDPEHSILNYAFDDGELLKLSVGRKRHAAIKRVG